LIGYLIDKTAIAHETGMAVFLIDQRAMRKEKQRAMRKEKQGMTI